MSPHSSGDRPRFDQTTRRSLGAAIAAVLVLTIGGVVAVVSEAQASGPSPTPLTQVSTASCITDSGGFCTVSHSLGAVPDAVLLTPNSPSGNNAFILNTVGGSFTPTTFTLRAMFNQTTPKTNGYISFSYAVYAPSSATPTSTTKTPPPTTPPTPTPTTPTSPSVPHFP